MDCRQDTGAAPPPEGGECCWFCKKGRHSECMVEMPTEGRVHDRDGGPHDCAFDTVMRRCACGHRDGPGDGSAGT